MLTETQIQTRKERGLEIVTTSRIVITEKGWKVPSQSGNGTYLVKSNGFEATCTCPDFKREITKCKHIWAVEFLVTDKIEPIRPTHEKESYSQQWSSYDKATINQKPIFMEMLSSLTSLVPQPDYSVGRPALPISDMTYASVMKVYSTFSFRRFMSDIEIAQSNDYVSIVPCYASIGHFMQREDITPILENLVRISSLPLKTVETDFSIDSTGFGTSNFQRWHSFKYGKEMRSKRWIKCHFIIGDKTNIITSVKITSELDNDSPHLKSLVDDTAYNFHMDEVACDKAYVSRKNLEIIDSYGAIPFIPFKSNSKARGKGALWYNMFYYFMLKGDEFYEHYHKRSNAETTVHMIKSKFGNSVRAKSWNAQVNEVLCKIICHNICVLIQEMYELNIDVDFTS